MYGQGLPRSSQQSQPWKLKNRVELGSLPNNCHAMFRANGRGKIHTKYCNAARQVLVIDFSFVLSNHDSFFYESFRVQWNIHTSKGLLLPFNRPWQS